MAGWGVGAWGYGTWGNGETILTGDAATGSVGTVTPSSSTALTGDTASGAVGTVAPVLTIALTGVSAAGSVGTVARGETSLALTGVAASGSLGTVAPSNTDAEFAIMKALGITPQWRPTPAANLTPEEKLAALKEMWVILPKHKASEKVQADLKTKISELTDEIEHARLGPKKAAQIGRAHV